MKLSFSGKAVYFRILIAVIFLTCILHACQKELSNDGQGTDNAEHSLLLQFRGVAGTSDLQFGNLYQNHFNEPFSVRTFKFYVHAIELNNAGTGKDFSSGKADHYLVDLSNPSSARIELKVPAQSYDQITFMLGVDSIRNVSGAQTDALDPAKGMFWTWNTGYIMAKLEGNSVVSPAPASVFEYHIGGFKGDENVVKKISLPLSELINLKTNKASEVTITADVYSWFYNPNDIHFIKNPYCHSPGTLAKQIAENYSNMFSIGKIMNKE
jgi:hypothetical protein